MGNYAGFDAAAAGANAQSQYDGAEDGFYINRDGRTERMHGLAGSDFIFTAFNTNGVLAAHTHPDTTNGGMPSLQDMFNSAIGNQVDATVGSRNSTAYGFVQTGGILGDPSRGLLFFSGYLDSVSGGGFGTSNGSNDPTGVGGVAAGGQSYNSATDSYGSSLNFSSMTADRRPGPVQIGGNSGNFAVGVPGNEYGNIAVIGGTPEQSITIGNSIRDIGSTPSGSGIISSIGGGLFTINVGPKGAYSQFGGAVTSDQTGEVFISSDFIVGPVCCYFSSVGRSQYDINRVMAHELGHLLGIKDDGLNMMNNVNQNENPVMNELNPASPDRVRYR